MTLRLLAWQITDNAPRGDIGPIQESISIRTARAELKCELEGSPPSQWVSWSPQALLEEVPDNISLLHRCSAFEV